MVKDFRKVLSMILVLLMIISCMPVIAYGHTADEKFSKENLFDMMVDTTPDLMSVEELIEFAASPDVSKATIGTVDINLQPSDYDDIEKVRQVIKGIVENLNTEGDEVKIDSALLDNILKQQQKLVEQSKTDRFIVKYKDGREDSFKGKVKNIIKKSVKIGCNSNNNNSGSIVIDIENSIYHNSLDTVGLASAKENKKELLVLKHSINPCEFAQTLKDSGVEDDIDYIQPDYQMELNALEDTPVSEEIMPEDTISSESGEEPAIELSVTEEAITTDEAISDKLTIDQPMNKKVIVAVIDTGLDITHPDLKDYIYTNPNEITDNGIDDDGNGYIDDINGWNFPNNSGNVNNEALGLEQAHATHIAGIITGASNADASLIPDQNIAILPLRVFNNGTAYTSDIIAAIDYAEKMGAKVVNCSFGSTNGNLALKEAIESSDMLFICSVGNARTDLSETSIYPACFGLDNIISVTSTNADGGLSYFSNYSSRFVDLAALGRDVNSTLPNGEYGLQSGTSMSTAMVSGVAARVLDTDNMLDSVGIKERLIKTSNMLSNLQEVVASGRQINATNTKNNLGQTDIVQNSPANDFDARGYNPTQDELYQLYSSSNIVQVSAGEEFSLVLKNDGTVWAWGDNADGQCGNGSTNYSMALTQVIGLTNIIRIAAGEEHCLALKSDGTVWAWGYNIYGKLGDGTTIDRTIPVQVSGLTNITRIAAGDNHSLAIKSDGTVWAWGSNSSGQLGDGSTTRRLTPVQVSGLTDAANVAAGSSHSLVIKLDGSVCAWGYNKYGQLGDGTTTTRTTPVQVSGVIDAVSVAAGSSHSLVIKSDRTVWVWGFNYYGQLGDNTTTTRTTPVQVSSLTDVTSVDAVNSHSLATKSDGTVWAWGYNNYGQLGDGTTTNRKIPGQVNGLNDAIFVAAGGYHSLAVKADGTVWTWGDNKYGQLGDGTTTIRTTPVQMSGLTDIVDIAGGNYHSLAIKSDGTVWAWGWNNYGELGDGTTTTRTTPVQVSGLTDVVSVTAGYCFSLAVKSDGTVWAWGYNNYGQLGDGTATTRKTPVQVSGLTDVVDIAGGDYHSIAMKSDGTVWAWGYNNFGQLGDITINRTTPVQISGLTDVVSVAAGKYHSLAIKSDGTVWAWGYNIGQLGDGSMTNRETPVQVSNLADVDSIAAGGCHSIALKSDGTIWVWGDNSYGQLGDGTTMRRLTPVQVIDLTGVTSITGGNNHSLAMKSDGTAWVWGYNFYGQLGDGTTVNRTTPVQMSGLSNVDSVAAGGNHSLAIKSDNYIVAWGSNTYGQLGQSRLLKSTIPIQCQAYDRLINFESTNYTANIPTLGSNIITVSAIGTDSYGNTIPASSISYSLASIYSGILINSATGAIAIDSSAQPGTVQLLATYQNQTCSATLVLNESGNSLNLSTVANSTEVTISPSAISINGFDANPYLYNKNGVDLGTWTNVAPYTDTGLAPNTQYTYKYRIKDSLGNISDYSTTASIYTLALDPINVTMSGIINSTMNINIQGNPQNGQAPEYLLELKLNGAGATGANVAVSDWSTSTAITFSGLNTSNNYELWITTRNCDGQANVKYLIEEITVLVYEYDASNRLTIIRLSNGEIIHYQYDANGNLVRTIRN